MVTAVFTDNDDYARAYGLWQWDYGQQLRIEGLHLPTAVEIHFALQETGGEAITRVGTTKDGVTTVTIPDSVLEGNRATWTADKAYNIYAWVYLSDKLSGETIKRITMQVKSRPKPEAFKAPEDGEIFQEAIEAVNDAAKRAEEAGDKAVVAADEAKAAATQTAEHLQATEGLAEQVETNADTVAQDKQTVTGMLSQAQQAASDAALSAQEAKLSETAAVQAQTGAEAAEDTARQYAEETEADRQAVANDKQAVTQMREAVAADRKAVEQTALQFGQTAQDALTAIGQAQSTAVGAVKAEGQKQTTAVQEAGTQAVSEVTEAKTTAVQAVTTEGDKQTKRVEDAAAGIVADREQISQNKADIATLAEEMTDLAPAIHNTASGSVISANDATEGRPFRGLRVFGKSTQDGTPSVENPVPIVNAGEGGSITVEVTGRNLIDYTKAKCGADVQFIDGGFIVGGDARHRIINIPFKFKKDKSYTTTFKCETLIGLGNINIYLPGGKYSVSGKAKEQYGIISNKPFVPLDEYTAIGFYVSLENTDTTKLKITDILLVETGTDTTYEPYKKPQSLTLATPNSLPGVPVDKDGNYTDKNGQQWITDEIDLGRGKYVQRVLKTKPNKTIVFNNRNENGRCALFDNSLFGTKWMNGTKQALSSIAQWSEWGDGADGTFALSTDGIYYKDSMKTLEEVNDMFAKIGTDFEVCGVLATPIERDLTPEEIAAYKALRTYGPTTVVSNDAGAGMEVTYVADTKTYIDNKFAALNKAVLDAVGGI